MLMRTRLHVDFSHVEDGHAEIHKRLENWGRWCRGRPTSYVQPMFRLYRPDEHWEGQAAAIPVDKIDAQRISKGVTALPTNHRSSMNWFYVSPTSPGRAARALATSLEGLALYVRDARTMLINRGI
jgi:hypothetical protein